MSVGYKKNGQYEPDTGGGQLIIANPTLEGSEDTLSSVQIGDNVYKIEAEESGGSVDYATSALNDVNGNQINTTYAPLASPILTGTPTVPTATSGTNNTQIANTAFVNSAINDALDDYTESDPTVPDHVKAITQSDINNWNDKADSSDIPTDLADLSDDSTHRLVTDTEKSTWSGKQDVLTTEQLSAVNSGITSSKVSTYDGYATDISSKISSTEKGANNGVATLGSDGKIPSSQLPSYVDDVLEYNNISSFPSEGESGKIYVDTSDNKTYRWSGSTYVEISTSIVIGTSTGTAFDGKSGYDHVNNTDNPHNVTKSQLGLGNVENKSSATIRGELTKENVTTALGYTPPETDTTYVNASESADGLMSAEDKAKLNTIDDNANYYVHPGTGTNPHGTTKSDIGLENVGNYKAVSTEASQGLTNTEKENARLNIGAGTSSFSGSYNDLTDQPTIPSGEAANKNVDTSISDSSDSVNLPTSAAVASFVEGKGYITSDQNTTYTLSQDPNDQFTIILTPSVGSPQTVNIPDNSVSSLSELSDDSTHRLVTDTEKSTWNAKADSSDIPTDLADLSDDSTHRLVTDTEKSTWSGKQDALPEVVKNRYLHTNASTGALEWSAVSGGGGTSDVATQLDNGLMSSEDKIKLDNITKQVIVSGTLEAGETSITLSDSNISPTTDLNLFGFYTSIYGVVPTSIEVNSGSITLEFEEQEDDMIVEVRVEGDGIWVDNDTKQANLINCTSANYGGNSAVSNVQNALNNLSTALTQKASISSNGTAGQFAVSDGNGGIQWVTLEIADTKSY